MDPTEFNDIPKDTVMIIGDMPKFIEFISFNSINKAVHKIIFNLFDQKTHALKLIEKYILRHSVDVRKHIEDECGKYVTAVDLTEEGDINYTSDGLLGNVFKENQSNDQMAHKVKRGDIDRLVINSTNDILYKVLQDMAQDKLVKLCWDTNSQDFIWVLRKPGEPDKVETKYKTIKKRTRKQK
jgi:hypothetical protein